MSAPTLDSTFCMSAAYRLLNFPPISDKGPSAVRETPANGSAAFSERHLQCIWYDPSLRPDKLFTIEGKPVTVVSPGRWNLEAGPDFLDAAISIGKDASILNGDVEIHLTPQDWTAHRHADGPAYDRVIAHVCLHKGEPPDSLPPCAVQIELAECLKEEHKMHPEYIDTASYPYSMPSMRNTLCSRCFPSLPLDTQAAILVSAGHERLRIKSARMIQLISEKGPGQTLYEEIMAALGYKHNRAPFRLLASLIPIEKLRSMSEGNTALAYALLMGTAGLLPDSLPQDADAESRNFLRSIWDQWWRHSSLVDSPQETNFNWHTAGVRPQNHPSRRLAAAACIFTAESPVGTMLDSLGGIPYWTRRLTLGGKVQKKPISLLGTNRKAAIITNVLAPFMTAQGEDVSPLLDELPPQSFNSITREMMNALTGGDYNAANYRHALIQQGLIQVFSDYCLGTRNTCQDCAFAKALMAI